MHNKLPEGTRCSWYCNKIVFYSNETLLNRSVYVVMLGALQLRRRNMMLPEWNFSPLVKQTGLCWYWEENVKSTALPFSACCSFTCYLIGTLGKGGSRVSFPAQWNISHSACSMSLSGFVWVCLVQGAGEVVLVPIHLWALEPAW